MSETYAKLNKYVEYEDIHNGYEFQIIHFSTTEDSWYCGYVRIPKGHKYFGMLYSDIDITVHGGLTYSEDREGDWWIGWDYNHGWDEERNFELLDFIKDCCGVIMQLMEKEAD